MFLFFSVNNNKNNLDTLYCAQNTIKFNRIKRLKKVLKWVLTHIWRKIKIEIYIQTKDLFFIFWNKWIFKVLKRKKNSTLKFQENVCFDYLFAFILYDYSDMQLNFWV